jgi:pyruvate,water dikinase
MSCGQLRHAVLAAARWLVRQGQLSGVEAIYWLRFDELLSALRMPDSLDIKLIIGTRQTQHAVWAATRPAPFYGMPPARLEPRPPAVQAKPADVEESPNQLTGIGASPGQVSGRARLMTNAHQLPDLRQGDILVAHNIGPRWTPMLSLLGGLVLNSGSVGQHAASTAREYGVPAVVATRQATERIRDGEWITLDGTTGVVTL